MEDCTKKCGNLQYCKTTSKLFMMERMAKKQTESAASILRKFQKAAKQRRDELEKELAAERETALTKHLNPLLEQKAAIESRIKEDGKTLHKLIKQIEKLTGVAEEKPTGERDRRTKEKLAEDAKAIVELAKADGGVNAAAMKPYKPGQNVVKWVKTHAGVELKPKGETSSRTYHA